MIFNIKDANKTSQEGFTAYVYNSKDDYPTLNTVYVDCFKGHEKVYVKTSHRVYFVIEGEGIFNINGKESSVKEKDVIVIEPMMEYFYQGKMKLFEVNYPATGEEDEVRAE